MALMVCKECNGTVSDTAATCPHCGAAVAASIGGTMQPTAPKKGGIWKWVLGVPVGLFVLMMIVGSLNSNPEKSSARQAYDLCMDSLKTDDRARRGNGAFIAGACEKMRNDFIAKYGVTP